MRQDDFLQQFTEEVASRLRGAHTGRLTTTQLSRAVNAHPQTVRAWAKRGCPHLMVGRSPRFLLVEVETWLAEQAAKGVA